MEIDEYLEEVGRFAAELIRQDMAFERYVSGLKQSCPQAAARVAFRRTVSTASELDSVNGYLEIGYFTDPDRDLEKAWWLFMFDVIRASKNLELEQMCQPYVPEQPLFVGAPDLFDRIRRRADTRSRDFELIDDHAITCIEGREVYRAGAGFSKLPSQLRPDIPAWARAQFPDAPRFVRLNPWEYHDELPAPRLMEAALVPADPKWMATLALFPNTKTFAAYALQDCDPKEDMEQYRDFHLRDVRRLEVTAQRREADYPSMMIEEIPRDDDPNGLMVGRCIHLDTRAPVGTLMTEARLVHLDLAINVYSGSRRAERMANSLQHGKACDATYRTHLFRIEDVPFPALFVFAEMFLESQRLLAEWIADLGLV
jgi:hypothetical protein